MNEWTTVITDDGEVAPVGEVGMLARRGHVPIGYYKDEAKTAATFVEMHGVRWAIPGDRAVIEDDGTITVLGRGSQCINTGGEKVFPEEVEAVLKSHPDVFDAIVVGVPDERLGESIAAVVAPRAGHAVTLDALRTFCRTALAGYKVPRHLVVVDEVRAHARGQAQLPLGEGASARVRRLSASGARTCVNLVRIAHAIDAGWSLATAVGSVARSAPARRARSFSHTSDGATSPMPADVSKPQSVPAMTRRGSPTAARDPLEPVGDDLGMLDVVARRVDHARDQAHARGQRARARSTRYSWAWRALAIETTSAPTCAS